MDYLKEIEKVRNSKYSDNIKDKLIKHYTKLSEINTLKIPKKTIKCNHYLRHNYIISPCCNKVYPCRLCHDTNENHKIDRKR